MRENLQKIIAKHYQNCPFIVTHEDASRGEMIVVFPREKTETKAFAELLEGAHVEGFRWNAQMIPIVVARVRFQAHGVWSALQVRRLPLEV